MSSFIRQVAYTATVLASLLLPGCISPGKVTEETASYVSYRSRHELESLLREGLQHPENQRTFRALRTAMVADGTERGGFFADSRYVQFFSVKNELENANAHLDAARKGDIAACCALENHIRLASYVRTKNQGCLVPLTHLYPVLYQARSGAMADAPWRMFTEQFNVEVKPWMYCMDGADFAAKQRQAGGPLIAHVHYHAGRCTSTRDGRDTPNQASRIDEELGLDRPELVMVPHEDKLEAWLTWKSVETFVGSIPMGESSVLVGPALLEK
ncbi:hypothetical protein HY493_05485 [Candidatus Woesearchaeota archaeon]|nr:hypothetical protein [Candidatus Woesearchaeota archaeon]